MTTSPAVVQAAAKTVEVTDLNLYYGAFHAVRDVNMTIAAEPRHRDHRLVRLREVDVPALAQPDARADPRRSRRGHGRARGRGHLRPERRSDRRAAADRHGLPGAEPVPDDVDLRQRRGRAEAQRAQDEEGRPRRGRRALAARREPLGRGQGPARQARHRALRRPAAAAVHRPRHRGRARGAADGRAGLRARPDRDARDRGAGRRSSRAGTPSSSSRTTCSRRRARAT